MLSKFRNLIRHPLGAAIALGFVVLLGLAFVLSDRSGLSGAGGSNKIDAADIVATVGSQTISVTDLRNAAQSDLETVRQQHPEATLAQYLAAGGLDSTLDRLVSSAAIQQFAAKQGMVVSKRTIDGIIASAPQLQGIDGKFSQQNYDAALRAQGMTDAMMRARLTDQVLGRAFLLPASSTDQVPLQLALPYADLLLEKRSGQIGQIPSSAIPPGPPPTDAEVATYYQRNLGQYRVPERRTLRYALVSPAAIAAEAAPSDAQIAAQFKADAAKYAATDLRTITQVIVSDAKAAAALAAKVRGGTSLDAAASAAGLAPATVKDQKQADYAAQSSPDIAKAAFAAKPGEVVGPLRAPLGFVVLRVESSKAQPARTLAEVAPQIRTTLTTNNAGGLLAAKRNAIDDALSGKSGFDAIVSREHLAAQSVPALTASGVDVDDPAYKPVAELPAIIKAAFASDPADGPLTVPLGQDGSFAVMVVDKVLPPAARPLAAIRDAVAHDLTLDRQVHAARNVAAAVIAAVGKGTPLAQALVATGLKLPPVDTISGPRAQLINDPRNTPAPLVLLFNMAPKTAKLADAPNKGGYAVIYLDSVEPGDARGKPQVIAGKSSDIGRVIGREYGEQLFKAIQQAVGTSKNARAVASVKAELSGVSAPDQP